MKSKLEERRKILCLALLATMLAGGCGVWRAVRQTDKRNEAEKVWNGNPFFAPTNSVTHPE